MSTALSDFSSNNQCDDEFVNLVKNSLSLKPSNDFQEEFEIFCDEPLEARIQRFLNPDQWKHEKTDSTIVCSSDTCWYSRVSSAEQATHCGSYRLMGTSSLYLCDACFNYYDFTQIVDEHAEQLFEDWQPHKKRDQ